MKKQLNTNIDETRLLEMKMEALKLGIGLNDLIERMWMNYQRQAAQTTDEEQIRMEDVK